MKKIEKLLDKFENVFFVLVIVSLIFLVVRVLVSIKGG